MSDDDRDIDIESDDENESDSGAMVPPRHISTAHFTQAEKRAHHNALERKRRDHIKDSFTNLREAVPTLKGEKASRAQILKKTTECIQGMRKKVCDTQKDVDELKKQNALLDAQIRMLEGTHGGCAPESIEYQNTEGDTDSDDDQQDFSRRNKKLKTFHT